MIPAWNEEQSLAEVVRGLENKVDQIIVVDDGSLDNTEQIAVNLPVDFLRHPVNRGQGAALKTGTLWALDQGADVIIHFDADGQFRAEDIAALVEPIARGEAEIVFGSRFHDKTTNMPTFKKKVVMPLARLVNRFLFGIRLADPQSGFRAFSRQVAEEIDWQQDEMAHCSEILVAAHRTGRPIKEVPVTVLYHQAGRGLGEGFKILRDFFLARLNN